MRPGVRGTQQRRTHGSRSHRRSQRQRSLHRSQRGGDEQVPHGRDHASGLQPDPRRGEGAALQGTRRCRGRFDTCRRAGGGEREGVLPTGHALRGAGLPLHRARGRPRPRLPRRHPLRGAFSRRSDSRPCHHPKGEGIRARRGERVQVARGFTIRQDLRRGQEEGRRTSALPESLRSRAQGARRSR